MAFLSRGAFKALGLAVFFSLILVLPVASALSAPEGLAEKVETGLDKAWKASVNNQGWSSAYNLPQQFFSAEKDTPGSFEDVGYWLLGASALDQADYDVNTQMLAKILMNLQEQIDELSKKTS